MRALRAQRRAAVAVAAMKTAPKRIRPRASTLARVGSARDLTVLGDLALSGMLTTGQIERLAFPSRRRAQRRLRAYLDLGLVSAHLQAEAMHRDSVWTMTAAGIEFLSEGGAPARGARPFRARARSQKLRHGLLVRDVTVSLLLAERAGLLALEDVRHDDELAGESAFATARLVPDGFALVRDGDRSVPLVWESVSMQQPFGQVQAKLLAYERAIAGGTSIFRHPELAVIFVFESLQRLKRLEVAAAGLRLRARLHTLSIEEARDPVAIAARILPPAQAFRPVP